MIPVPTLWPGSTVAILAGGPSLNQADIVTAIGAGCRILAIKDAIRLCPEPDLLYACDAKWWNHYGPTLAYDGPRYGIEPEPKRAPHAPPRGWAWPSLLQNTGVFGLERDPSGVRTGKNSGYQAINLAVHLGAVRILLLGFDMRMVKSRHHWFGEHPYRTTDPPYDEFRRCFTLGDSKGPSLVDALQTLGVQVVNVTPDSSLTAFPRCTLAEALEVAA